MGGERVVKLVASVGVVVVTQSKAVGLVVLAIGILVLGVATHVTRPCPIGWVNEYKVLMYLLSFWSVVCAAIGVVLDVSRSWPLFFVLVVGWGVVVVAYLGLYRDIQRCWGCWDQSQGEVS